MKRANSGQRRLALAPADWFWATWRNLDPLPLPEAPVFDRQAAIERLRKRSAQGWDWGLERTPAMQRDEAAFWLHAMQCSAEDLTYCKRPLVERLHTASPEDIPKDPAEIIPALRPWFRHGFWVPLRTFFPLAQVLDAFVRTEAALTTRWTCYYALPALRSGFRELVVTHLTPKEAEEARQALRPHLTPNMWPVAPGDPPPLALLFAAALGMPEAVRPCVEALSAEGSAPEPEIVFGLGSAAEVEHHARRLKLRLRDPDHARAWLAHTEFSALDWLGDSVIAIKRSGEAMPLARVLALAHGSETAPVMLEVLSRSRVPQIAQKWFDANPEHAAAGLVDLCIQRGRIHEAPLQVLRGLHGGGHAGAVDSALEQAGPVGERLREAISGKKEDGVPSFDPAVLPEELQAPFRGSPPPLPKFLAGQALPAVLIDGRRLTEEHLGVLFGALRESTLAQPHPLVTALKERAGPAAADLLAMRLLELYEWARMPRKEAWALLAAGVLGGDGCALRLGSLAVQWRKNGIHQPARDAIDCLKAIGTDTALLQLRNFTQIPREWSLKETARQHLVEAAQARGCTLEELEDRMVPDCGLDSRGSRTFDYGARRFTFTLGQGAKPMVRDEAGKLRPDVPKPTAKDDPALAEASAAAWKLLKKQLGEVLKLQQARLEQAMVCGRRWTAEDFQALIVRDPVMTLLARGLVWGAYDASGNLAATFRVAEDQTLADADDAPLPLSGDVAVGIPHPIRLASELKQAWGERLNDYELWPPFPQLSRPVYAAAPAEAGLLETTRFNGIPCLAMALINGLERRGWRRDEARDGGCFFRHLRVFPSGLNATAEYEPGIPSWDARSADVQQVRRVAFYGADDTPPIPLGQVDPIVYSEVIADLSALTAHG